MNITSDMIYGYTDGIILRCLMDGDSYGYDLNSSVSKKSDHQYERKEATLYTTVRRLEKQGYATSYWGEEKLRRYLDRAFFGIRCSPAHNARTSKCLSPKHFEVL